MRGEGLMYRVDGGVPSALRNRVMPALRNGAPEADYFYHYGDSMNIRFAKLAVASAVLSFAGLAVAADPIKIGVDGPFTGGSSSMGVSMRDGVRLAVEEVNKSGGVLGRKLQLVERDDEAKNERGVQIAQELINKEKVTAVVGYINTGVALASQRFFQEAKIPVMNNVATGSVITSQFKDQPDNYIFRNSANDSIQAPMIVDEAINETGELFAIQLREGPVIEARRILLAIGIKDFWPDIPGLERCYGETIHVCPDCDGYETRDKKTVVVGKGRKAVGMALALTNWTREIVICTNGEPPEIRQSLLDQLKALNIPVLDAPIKCVTSRDTEIMGLELEGGMSLDCERLYFAIGQYPADDLGAQLGCKRDEMGRLVIDDRNHTSVKNVYAAGDIAPGPQLAIFAAASGAVAAIAIHASLMPEARKLPV